MKTKNYLSSQFQVSVKKVVTFVICIVCMTWSQAQSNKQIVPDYLMPSNGKSAISVCSGIPYVGIAEYSYGISEKFSLGVIFGTTPVLIGYGLRVKAVLYQRSDDFRVVMKTPLIYYPKTKDLGGDPWILAWPSANAEWKFENGARVWTGIGIVGAACVNYLFGIEKDHHSENHNDPNHLMESDKVMADLWGTLSIGYSDRLSSNISYMIEVAPVFKQFKLANPINWIGGPPVILTFGVTCHL